MTRAGERAIEPMGAADAPTSCNPQRAILRVEPMQQATVYQKPRGTPRAGEVMVISACGHNCGGRYLAP